MQLPINAIGVAIGKMPLGLVPKAASTALLAYGFVSGLASLIIDKYLKNRAIVAKIWFSYQYKNSIKYVRKKGKLRSYKSKWVRIYNIKRQVKLGAKC